MPKDALPAFNHWLILAYDIIELMTNIVIKSLLIDMVLVESAVCIVALPLSKLDHIYHWDNHGAVHVALVSITASLKDLINLTGTLFPILQTRKHVGNWVEVFFIGAIEGELHLLLKYVAPVSECLKDASLSESSRSKCLLTVLV